MVIRTRRFLGSGGAGAARESASEAIPEDAAARRLRREIKPWHGDGPCARSAGCSPEEEGISDFAPMLADLRTSLLRSQSYRTLKSWFLHGPSGRGRRIGAPQLKESVYV